MIPETISEMKAQRFSAAQAGHMVFVSLMFCMQVYLFGVSYMFKATSNGAWIASLMAIPAAIVLFLLIHVMRKRNDMMNLTELFVSTLGVFFGKLACVLVALLFMLDMAAEMAMLAAVTKTYLLQGQGVVTILVPMLLAVFVVVFTSAKGLERLAYLSRRVLFAILLISGIFMVQGEPMSNLFPLIGKDVSTTFSASLCATGSAMCVLAAGFAPITLKLDKPKPDLRQGVVYLSVAGVIACSMLFMVVLSVPYHLFGQQAHWATFVLPAGSYKTAGGISHLLMTCILCYVMLLSMGGSVHFSSTSLASLMPPIAANIIVVVFSLVIVVVVMFLGGNWLLPLLSVRFIPAGAILLLTFIVDSIKQRRRKTA